MLKDYSRTGQAMIEEDLMSSLTRQVKEEVIENYLTERRLVGIQIEEIEDRVAQLKRSAVWVGRRLNRIVQLMVEKDMKDRLFAVIGIPHPSFWSDSTEKKFSRRVHFIRVSGLTDRRRFRKLVLESYQRFHDHMTTYHESYVDLHADCEAININIRNFQKNFDLLNILSFLRSLDTQSIERKHFLGENFTSEELASIDQKLHIKPISLAEYDIPIPFKTPDPSSVERILVDLSDEVYRKYEKQVRSLML